MNAADEISLSTQQQLQNQINESSLGYTRGSPADKIGEKKSAMASSSASTGKQYLLLSKMIWANQRKSSFPYGLKNYCLHFTVPRYGYRDSPRITKKFEFTYPGTTSLFAPGSPGNHAGGNPSSSHATTSGQQFYNRLASGTLGLTGGEERKTSGSGGYHSLVTVPSSGVLGGSTSLSTTLPQSHTR